MKIGQKNPKWRLRTKRDGRWSLHHKGCQLKSSRQDNKDGKVFASRTATNKPLHYEAQRDGEIADMCVRTNDGRKEAFASRMTTTSVKQPRGVCAPRMTAKKPLHHRWCR